MSYRRAVLALPFVFASVAHAQDAKLCRIVANHLWSEVATAPLTEQTPLAELKAVAPAAFLVDGTSLAKPGRSMADTLVQDHAADPDLAGRLRDLPPTDATRFGGTNVWLLDRVDGTLGCHTAMTVIVPPDGPAHETALPGDPDPTALCALSALSAVSIDGTPALWIEQSGAFSNSLGQSTISIAGLRDGIFSPPCTMEVDYTVTDRAAHALCDGVDCVPLIRTAEILAMRLRQEEPSDDFGAGAIQNDQDDVSYRRMAEIVASEKQPAELPVFGASIAASYTTFADQVTFPLRLEDGHLYLARLGHGGIGWRKTADTLLGVYRLRDDRLVAAASVYISARRTGITAVTVQ